MTPAAANDPTQDDPSAPLHFDAAKYCGEWYVLESMLHPSITRSWYPAAAAVGDAMASYEDAQ